MALPQLSYLIQQMKQTADTIAEKCEAKIVKKIKNIFKEAVSTNVDAVINLIVLDQISNSDKIQVINTKISELDQNFKNQLAAASITGDVPNSLSAQLLFMIKNSLLVLVSEYEELSDPNIINAAANIAKLATDTSLVKEAYDYAYSVLKAASIVRKEIATNLTSKEKTSIARILQSALDSLKMAITNGLNMKNLYNTKPSVAATLSENATNSIGNLLKNKYTEFYAKTDERWALVKARIKSWLIDQIKNPDKMDTEAADTECYKYILELFGPTALDAVEDKVAKPKDVVNDIPKEPETTTLTNSNKTSAEKYRDYQNAIDPKSYSKLIRSIVRERSRVDKYYAFDRVGVLDASNIINCKEYVFFTKPDLHIFDNCNPNKLNPELENVPLFVDAFARYWDVLKQLQTSNKDSTSPFMNLLTNTLKTTVELPTLSAGDTTTSANIYGTAITYRESSIASDDGHEFTLEFEDSKYLEVYMLFKIFDEYYRRKYHGDITPPSRNYTINKILHDQFSIYKFIVGEDGESILYAAKLYGVYPKGCPREVFSDLQTGAPLRISIPFRCQFVEDQNPAIYNDFNTLVAEKRDSKRNIIELYDNENERSNIEYGKMPFIAFDNSYLRKDGIKAASHYYKLKWEATTMKKNSGTEEVITGE